MASQSQDMYDVFYSGIAPPKSSKGMQEQKLAKTSRSLKYIDEDNSEFLSPLQSARQFPIDNTDKGLATSVDFYSQVASSQGAGQEVSRVASPRVASPRASRVASPRVASPRVASPRVASPRMSLPRVASPRVAQASSPVRPPRKSDISPGQLPLPKITTLLQSAPNGILTSLLPGSYAPKLLPKQILQPGSIMFEVLNYKIISVLGKGSFGTTYLAYDTNKRINVALKVINKVSDKSVKSAIEEALMLKDLSEKGCKYLSCYYNSFTNDDKVYIASEYIEGQTLRKFILNSTPLKPQVLWPIMLQLILGLAYIHEQGYAHRDIKPDNIMITKEGQIKYIDFGFACVEKCKIENCTNECDDIPKGTVYYFSPEGAAKRRMKDFNDIKARDIWSLTMVFYEVVNGMDQFPYNVWYFGKALPLREILVNIKNMDYVTPSSSKYTLDDGRTNKFISSLVVPNPELRPNIQTILNFFISDILSVPLTVSKV